MTIYLKQLIVSVALTTVFSQTMFQSPIFAQNSSTLLKGNINEQNYLTPSKGPSLNAGDLNRNQDAFGKSGTTTLPFVNETFEPPSEAFNLNANKTGTGGNGVPVSSAGVPFSEANSPGSPVQSGVPGLDNTEQPESAVPGLDNAPPYNLGAEQDNDAADNTPDMQLAWDQWHKRVAAAIYQKFNALAQAAFQYSHPIACYVTYTVTKDGRVIDVKLSQQSTNVAFNAMVMMVVNSMSGQTDLLAFPAGSQRTAVNKAGMFTQNYGMQGFKYTTGDKETIPGR